MEEIEEQRDFLSDKHLRTIYFGGGTPSLLSAEQVARFLERISSVYDVSGVEEVTLEANPDDLSEEFLCAIRRVGVNRLSIGIQSFDDAELKFMNRRHTATQAAEAVRRAREAGFDNIAIDLIFGVSGFDEEILRHSVQSAIDLGVEHIAAYHLTIEPNTLFDRRVQRGEFSRVEESVSENEYNLIHTMLTQAGYEHYEISNYSKPQRRSRHNSSYWRGVEYLGIGAGAHSYNGDVRRWGVNSLDRYLAGGEERYESEVLSVQDKRNEMVMTRLRCAEGLGVEEFGRVFGEHSLERLKAQAERWILSGEMELREGRLMIIPMFYMVSDMIIESMFEI